MTSFETLFSQALPQIQGSLNRLKVRLKSLCYSFIHSQVIGNPLTTDELVSLKNLSSRKDVVFIKPDKGNGVVVMDHSDYVNKINDILSDHSKFKILDTDPTEQRESKLQRFLCRLHKKGSLDESTYGLIRPTGSTPSQLYGLPKVHKVGVPLRPIISQIGSYTYQLAKFLVPILSPLTTNSYTITDSFAFVNELMSMKETPFMASFDVVSLFTNIPLIETVEICLDKLFSNSDKVHNLTREDLKKLIIFAAQENHFIFNNKIYDQVDGVSMGSPLGPILANIFMCHLENKAMDTYLGIKPLVYRRYVDDCFLVFKSKRLCSAFFDFLNKQHPNITFTREDESNSEIPFLDILIKRNSEGLLDTSIYRKPTFSGLYLKWSSFIPKQFKINLLTCLLNRAWRICSNSDLFHKEVIFIKDTLSANGYPSTFVNTITQKFINRKQSNDIKEIHCGPDKKNVFLSLPYKGSHSTKLKRQLNRLFAKLAPSVKLNIIFSASNKLSKLCKLKCKLPIAKQSNVIYKVACGNCTEFYIGKTNRRLQTRLNEHKKDVNSALNEHSILTDHNIDYAGVKILAKDSHNYRLLIKETLKIQEQYAFSSLNRNVGSLKLKLWSGD